MTQHAHSSFVSGGTTLPADLTLTPALITTLGGFCRLHGLRDERWLNVELAVTEALNNAIEHGAGGDATKSISIQWTWKDNLLAVVVRDPGSYMPPEGMSPELPEDPLAEGGRGTFLMHQLAAKVEHRLVPGGHEIGLAFETGAAPGDAAAACVETEETLRMMTDDLSSAYENLSALFRLSESLASSDNLGVFLERSLDELFRLVGCDGIHIGGLSAGRLEPLAARGPVPPALAGGFVPAPEHAQGRAAVAARETTVERPSKLEDGDPLKSAAGPLYVCPMALSNRVLGVMTLFLEPGRSYFTAGQLRLARTFADVIAIAMAGDLLQRERGQQQRVLRELEIAAELQTRLLPKSFPKGPPWEAWGVCQSARQAGGDFFDLIPLGHDRMVATVADVMGKGISAAMVSTIFRTIFHSAIDLAGDPEVMISHIADLTYQEINDLEVYITAQIVLFDATSSCLRLSAAGHCPLLHVTADGTITEHSPNGFPLGLFESTGYDQITIPLVPGDRILLFTDGFPEAETADGGMIGDEGFHALIRKHRAKSCRDFCRQIMQDLDKATGGREAGDDRTLLVVDFLPTSR